MKGRERQTRTGRESYIVGAGEIAQWPRELSAIAEDLTLVLSIHARWLITTCNPTPGRLGTLFLYSLGICTYILHWKQVATSISEEHQRGSVKTPSSARRHWQKHSKYCSLYSILLSMNYFDSNIRINSTLYIFRHRASLCIPGWPCIPNSHVPTHWQIGLQVYNTISKLDPS